MSFNKKYLSKEQEDEELDIEEEVRRQPLLIDTIENTIKDYPCPNIVYAWAYLLERSGWSERAKDYKLSQVARICDDACHLRDFMAKRYYADMRDEIKKIEYEKADKEVEDTAINIEKNIFKDHVCKKRTIDEVVNEPPLKVVRSLDLSEDFDLKSQDSESSDMEDYIYHS